MAQSPTYISGRLRCRCDMCQRSDPSGHSGARHRLSSDLGPSDAQSKDSRFVAPGLVDRYHLLVFPVLLGAGLRLWSEADKDTRKLKLVEHEVYSDGIQKQVFDVVG